MKQQQQHAPPALPEPAPDGRSAAAAAELEAMGMDPDGIAELVALETTTREWVLAWSIEGSKGHIRNKPGFVRDQLRIGKRPPELSLRKARDRLERQQLGAAAIAGRQRGPVELTPEAKALIEAELPEESKRFFREHAERRTPPAG